MNLHLEGLDAKVAALLNLGETEPDLSAWHDLLHRIRNPKGSVRIAIVGKYVEFKESYKSLTEALHHAGYGLETQVDLKWVEGEEMETRIRRPSSRTATASWCPAASACAAPRA